MDIKHLKIYHEKGKLLNHISVNSTRNKKRHKELKFGGVLYDLSSKPLKHIFYKRQRLTCHNCENTFFFKINSSLARSTVSNFFSIFAGIYELIKHPMKMYVCANCLTCKMIYPSTIWNRIGNVIWERGASKSILKELGYKKYIKKGSLPDDEYDSDEDDSDEDDNNSSKNNKKNDIKNKTSRIDSVSMPIFQNGGIGLKSHTIVVLKYKHNTVKCPVCQFTLFYKLFMTFKPPKKDTMMYDLMYTLYGTNSLASSMTGSIGTAIYNKIEEGIIESYSQPVTSYVCGECYNTLIVYPSTLHNQHKNLIKSYEKYKRNIKIKKNEMKKLNSLRNYPDNDPIVEEYLEDSKEKYTLNKLFKQKDEKNKNEEYKNKSVGGFLGFTSSIKNQTPINKPHFQPVVFEKMHNDTKKKSTNAINADSIVDRLDFPLGKIKYKDYTFFCPICTNEDFYSVNMSIQRSKTWQILFPRFVLFNHPVIIYICNNCFCSTVRYNFSLLDYNPRYN